MMFPSVAPTVALHARITKERSPLSPWLLAGGYLLTWTAAGLVAYAVGVTATKILGDTLASHGAGRELAGATLIVAAVYEVTQLKDVCLGKCRSPLGVLLASWREGRSGAVRMGGKNGAWCVGCCWALMASSYARSRRPVVVRQSQLPTRSPFGRLDSESERSPAPRF
jgi:predicted metal-binding membrane protein